MTGCARSRRDRSHEEDLECPAATDQAGEPGHRTAPGNHTDADFPLAEMRVLARGEPQITGEHELGFPRRGPSRTQVELLGGLDLSTSLRGMLLDTFAT